MGKGERGTGRCRPGTLRCERNTLSCVVTAGAPRRRLRWGTEDPQIDWGMFMGKKKEELRRLNGVYNKMLGNAGVTYIEGRGKLVDRHTVDVDGKKYTVRLSVTSRPYPEAPRLLRRRCLGDTCV